MSTKSIYEVLDVKLDETGAVDMDFYQAQAEKLRAEHHAEMLRNAKSAIKSFFSVICDNTLCAFLKPSH